MPRDRAAEEPRPIDPDLTLERRPGRDEVRRVPAPAPEMDVEDLDEPAEPERERVNIPIPSLAAEPVASRDPVPRKREPLRLEADPVALPRLDRFDKRFWEQVNRIAAVIQATGSSDPKSVLFTAVESGAGASTIALAVATLLVRDPGVEVLLIDAQSRASERPGVLPGREAGLIQLAASEASLGDVLVPTDRNGLTYLSRGSGSYNGPKMFERVGPILAGLEDRFDYMILDAAPVLIAPESAQLAGTCDGVVVVLASERTPKADARRTRDLLEQHDSQILGTVINRARRGRFWR